MLSSLLTPLLLGSGVMGFLGAVFTAIYTRRNMRADTAQKISEASGGLLDQFQSTNNEVRARLARVERVSRVQRAVLDDIFSEMSSKGVDVSPYRERLDKAEEFTAAERAALPESQE